MDPDALPAGPDLDRLVAEHVMGWRSLDDSLEAHYQRDDWCDVALEDEEGYEKAQQALTYPMYNYGEQEEIVVCRSYETVVEGEPWSPSTNIAHAWEVVERLASPRCRPNVYMLHPEDAEVDGFGEWGCQFLDCETDDDVGRGYGDTAALAICRAALKASAKTLPAR